MKQPTGKDWIALERSGELQKCAQAIHEDTDRETRLAQTEERRERSAAAVNRY